MRELSAKARVGTLRGRKKMPKQADTKCSATYSASCNPRLGGRSRTIVTKVQRSQGLGLSRHGTA